MQGATISRINAKSFIQRSLLTAIVAAIMVRGFILKGSSRLGTVKQQGFQNVKSRFQSSLPTMVPATAYWTGIHAATAVQKAYRTGMLLGMISVGSQGKTIEGEESPLSRIEEGRGMEARSGAYI